MAKNCHRHARIQEAQHVRSSTMTKVEERETERSDCGTITGMMREKSCSQRNGIGTTRFPNLKSMLPEGYKWVNARPSKVQKTTRLLTIWPEEWPRLSTKQKGRGDSSLGRRKDQIARSSLKKRNLRRFIRRYRIPRGDLHSSSNIRQVRGSSNAVYSKR